MEQFIWLIPLGLAVGIIGTLIGAGGGFILVPILLLIYPSKDPELITSISLAVVFCNALSGSAAYARIKKIDYKSGLMFAVATVPGAILGAITSSYIPRFYFNILFGVILVALAVYLLLRPKNMKSKEPGADEGGFRRQITDADGVTHDFTYKPTIGIVLSLFIGYISSLLGIGGGIIHVPMLVYLLGFPVHIATATSHFVLVITAFAGSIIHIINGDLAKNSILVIGLAIGVIFGAQIGAKLSQKVKGNFIIRGLAIALGLVGIRIIFMSLL